MPTFAVILPAAGKSSRFRDAYGNGATPSLAAVQRIYNIIDGRVTR